MMSDEHDEILRTYPDPADDRRAEDDVIEIDTSRLVESVGYRTHKTAEERSYKGPPNPKPYTGPREPIDPKPMGWVRLSRRTDMPLVDGTIYEDAPEGAEVIDPVTMTRMSLGRVASRYDFGPPVSVYYQGASWIVETWRERAMRLEGPKSVCAPPTDWCWRCRQRGCAHV